MIWQGQYDTERRADLRGVDGEYRGGLKNVDVRKKKLMLAVADKAIRVVFQTVANALGLYDYHLADMDQVAEVSHAFYDNNLRGGEGHMEVGKLILNIAKTKVNMTLSVKPFGCMPSSSVSDGVQSLITEMYPEGLFLPIETNGDGAVNVYSRVQMQLFKAKQIAQREVDRELKKAGMTMEQVQMYLKKYPRLNNAFHKPPHVAGCTTADLVAEVAQRRNRISAFKTKVRDLLLGRRKKAEQRSWLVNVAKLAAAKARTKAATRAVRTDVRTDVDPEFLDGMAPPPPKGKKSLRVLN
jgi:DNA-binding transcriptional MerR regulator